jgi:hypothetical protein
MASDRVEVEVEADDAFMRKIVFPEEDRHKFTTRPWSGEYRWFRSANVIPIERYRKRKVRQAVNSTSSAGDKSA